MPSRSILERPLLGGDHRVRELLVMWQHPTTREIIPIGRFSHHDGAYTFAYTRAAAAIDGFRPLPGLPKLNQFYESERLPAIFGQRIMDRDRPDFRRYVEGLGLDPAHVTPWEQIVESGGGRAGDTLQFMSIPQVIVGRAVARFLVNGIRHIRDQPLIIAERRIDVTDEDHACAMNRLASGSTVQIEAEDDNHRDANACLVVAGSTPVGWVPRALSASMRELMAAGPISATVVRAAGPEMLPHVRLVIEVDAPAPLGFEFDRERRWEPLAAAQ